MSTSEVTSTDISMSDSVAMVESISISYDAQYRILT